MAYEAKNLSAMGYANGFTLWHYRTTDLAGEVDNAGYFNPASRMVRISRSRTLIAPLRGSGVAPVRRRRRGEPGLPGRGARAR